jgi:hypothetical protein
MKVKQNHAQDAPTARRIGDALKGPTEIRKKGKSPWPSDLGADI